MRLPTERLVNRLRAEGFKHKRQADRVHFYKRGTKYVPVPRSTYVVEELAVSLLRQAGVSEPEIAGFIQSCKV